jgi:uncharacterized UBP type Zn finger protein
MAGSRLGDAIRRVVFQRSIRQRACDHLDSVVVTSPGSERCEDCTREGTRTVHLRMCLVCGNVGCCDSSPAKHARRHHDTTGHEVIRSIEPGEHWVWCYLDRAYLADVPDVDGR